MTLLDGTLLHERTYYHRVPREELERMRIRGSPSETVGFRPDAPAKPGSGRFATPKVTKRP